LSQSEVNIHAYGLDVSSDGLLQGELSDGNLTEPLAETFIMDVYVDVYVDVYGDGYGEEDDGCS
jgi:hypothetical protein